METPRTAPVVVGVNGTSAGLAAVRFAAREALSRGRRLRVVHALTWPDPKYQGKEPGYASARRSAGQVVDRAMATARRSTPGVRVSGDVVDGPPTRVLLQQSRSAELLVLGGEDLSGPAHLPTDSVLLQSVARAFCPAVVSRGLRPPVGPLVAAIDGSGTSLEALRLAAAEAARRSVAVEVLHVAEPGDADAADRGRELLAASIAAVPELRGATGRLLTGDPAEVLARESRHARMMIVGPSGRHGSAPLGPVAYQLLTRCACPTLFVHGTTAARARRTGTVPRSGAPAR